MTTGEEFRAPAILGHSRMGAYYPSAGMVSLALGLVDTDVSCQFSLPVVHGNPAKRIRPKRIRPKRIRPQKDSTQKDLDY